MSKLKILMLDYEFPPIGGGAGTTLFYLLKQYSGFSGLTVDVLTSAPEPGFFEDRFAENITIYKIGVHKKDLHYWRKIEVLEWLAKSWFHYQKMLRENDYDMAHALSGFPTGWLCERTVDKLPYLISLLGSDVPGKHARLQLDYKILAPLFKAIWKKAAGLVACSEGLKQRALRFLPAVPIDVIPNGIETDRFCPSETAKEHDTLGLLTVGRLSVTKRVEMLIDAVEILHRDGLKVHFTVVGGGQLEEKLRQLVRQKNLDDVIEITGRLDTEKMPDIYRQNDILISATMQEGMSNAMLEAMATGLPIVTPACEGAEELITDNGIVVEQAQPEQIAKAIKKLADDRGLRSQMSAAAIKRCRQFSWPSIAREYIRHYEAIAHE
jgi:glycosyltransferase involved in cell wall biosynthesis